MTQMAASGGEVGIVNLIGNHECSNTPPSLFNDDETMRAAGTNASPVKVLREETGVLGLFLICHNRIWRQLW